MISELPEAGIRARRRIACRLLPFVFLIYVVNFIDRVNVSFANLRMSTDLGLSDRDVRPRRRHVLPDLCSV